MRGVAVLGVLAMNMEDFAVAGAPGADLAFTGGLDSVNYWAWYVGHTLARNKFFTIFSMLFGAGIVLMSSRQKLSGWPAALVYYRRMLALMLIGLLHACLLWSGDILFYYGSCGLFLFFFRKLHSWVVITLGVLLMTGSFSYTVYSSAARRPQQAEGSLEAPSPSAAAKKRLDQEAQAYLGGWRPELAYRLPEVWRTHSGPLILRDLPLPGGLMLLGMGLFRLGMFSAVLSRRAYLLFISAGGLVGLPLILYGTWPQGERTPLRFIAGWLNVYGGATLVSLGYVAAVMLAWRSQRLRPWLSSLAAVGQMALTNYLMHSAICTEIFYGRGLGLLGRVDRLGQAGVVVAVAALQLAVSPVWLRYFRFGPAEWMWRTLTYWTHQPLYRRSREASRVEASFRIE